MPHKPAPRAPRRAGAKKMINSVQKAAEILNVFIDDDTPLGITDFARRLGLPKPTVQNLVQTLEHLGYLEKNDATFKYSLGPALFQLGMKYATNMDLVATARVWMENLCLQFHEAVHVGMLVGDKVVIVLRVEPESRFMVFPQVGSVIPFHSTGIGKVLFAFMDGPRREHLMEKSEFPGLTANTIVSPGAYLGELERVRAEGLAFDNEESVAGLSCVSAPIFGERGQVIAAFSVTGRTETFCAQKEKIINAVRYTGSRISAQMGYRGA
ncbi:MAG: IclR family transcriptional regulator [Spirochaetes bacterium]|nr:MAG: IclR family transcriptional regulator [Spirochaetota bacterium]